jgi:lysophospholipase L1-like esterase
LHKSKEGIRTHMVILISLFISCLANPISAVSDDFSVERGEIVIKGETFNYEKSHYYLSVYDHSNKQVFNWISEDPDIGLLNFTYSHIWDTFLVFKQVMDPEAFTFTLILQGSSFEIPVIQNSKLPAYTPILVENENGDTLVVYITDEPALVTYDVGNGDVISHLKFEKPIYRLKKEKVNGQEVITFRKFDSGKSVPYFFPTKNIASPHFKRLPLIDTKHEPLELEPEEMDIALPQIQLDEKIIVGFGDSITRGKQKGEVLPHKGYIPRLELLVNTEFYLNGDGYVINEGVLADKTSQAAGRIVQVILSHQGKYLLFHEGTNDSIHWEISLATVEANIEYIMETALSYGVQPIISTLIPRDPNDKTGQGQSRYRAISISDYIRTLAQQLDIPMVDFWNVFTMYQDQGGFYSVMSDYVHPDDTGYQIMAEEWLKALLSLPPAMPQNVQVVYTSPFRARVQWLANIEQDFSHYIVKYGFAADHLDQTDTTTDNTYDFLFYPLRGPFRSQIYVRIQAVDQDGNKSDFTPRCTVTFQ